MRATRPPPGPLPRPRRNRPRSPRPFTLPPSILQPLHPLQPLQPLQPSTLPFTLSTLNQEPGAFRNGPQTPPPPPRARCARPARKGDHERRTRGARRVERLLPRVGDHDERIHRKRGTDGLSRPRAHQARVAVRLRLLGHDVPGLGQGPRLRRHGGQRPSVRDRHVARRERRIARLGDAPGGVQRDAVRHGLPLVEERQDPQRRQPVRDLHRRLAPQRIRFGGKQHGDRGLVGKEPRRLRAGHRPVRFRRQARRFVAHEHRLRPEQHGRRRRSRRPDETGHVQ